MRCGTKCFIVEYERAGEIRTVEVNSRSSIEARKIIRQNEPGNLSIKTVTEKRK